MSVPANAVAAMVSALNQAGFAMLHHLAASDAAGNLFLSPFSVGGAFGLAYTGAAGDTAAQIRTALGFPDGGVDACGELFATLHAAYAALDRIKVFVSNSIWADAALPVLPAYLDAVQCYYGGAFYQEDFAQGAAVAAKINAYVEDRTSRMIQNLLSPTSRAAPPCDQPFALPGGGTRTVRLMYQKVRLPYFVDDTAAAHGVVLPYKDPRFALIAVMPLEPGADQGVAGLDRLVARLAGDAAVLQGWIDAAEPEETHLHLPRTTLAYKAELSGPLQSLGIADAFTPRADFSGITAPSQLVVSSVIHQTALQMDEVSTRAAAATAVMMMRCALMPPRRKIVFRADRPFLVLIRDMDTGLVLFEGRAAAPPPALSHSPRPLAGGAGSFLFLLLYHPPFLFSAVPILSTSSPPASLQRGERRGEGGAGPSLSGAGPSFSGEGAGPSLWGGLDPPLSRPLASPRVDVCLPKGG
eukprot:gene1784-1080_t